ncbi:MAG: hypothetical protein KatS3mg015_2937 [Fimbriimonadales bacterium]|nr:MAG: hypothetical protein KatS3mg015_2937 [Fimbriimonadales bacterium]
MAISGRQTNTMAEFIQKMLRLITDAKIAPDSDLPFLVNLETQLLQYVKQPMEEAGMDMSGLDAGLNAGTLPGEPALVGNRVGFSPTPGGGVPGIRQGMNMPPVDDLARLLTQ